MVAIILTIITFCLLKHHVHTPKNCEPSVNLPRLGSLEPEAFGAGVFGVAFFLLSRPRNS